MERDELMKPRYKVIAEWPGQEEIQVGEILHGIAKEIGPIVFRLDAFPHLFRKLEWWEERKPEDMPEYVNDEDENKIFKVSFIMQEYRGRQQMVIIFPDERPYHVNDNVMPLYEPATEAEYLAFTTPAPSAD